MLKLSVGDFGKIVTFREELPKQTVRILVRSLLPGGVRIDKVNVEIMPSFQLDMARKFFAPVYGSRLNRRLRILSGQYPDKISMDIAIRSGILIA